MKRLFTTLITFAIIAACLIGCGKNTNDNATSQLSTETKTEQQNNKNSIITGEVIHITENIFLTYVKDIYANYKNYIGKTIKIEGLCTADEHSGHSHYYVYRYNSIYDPDHGHDHTEKIGFGFTYNGNMPKENDWIEVVGVLCTYIENEKTFLTLDAKSIVIMNVRGMETVSQ